MSLALQVLEYLMSNPSFNALVYIAGFFTGLFSAWFIYKKHIKTMLTNKAINKEYENTISFLKLQLQTSKKDCETKNNEISLQKLNLKKLDKEILEYKANIAKLQQELTQATKYTHDIDCFNTIDINNRVYKASIIFSHNSKLLICPNLSDSTCNILNKTCPYFSFAKTSNIP